MIYLAQKCHMSMIFTPASALLNSSCLSVFIWLISADCDWTWFLRVSSSCKNIGNIWIYYQKLRKLFSIEVLKLSLVMTHICDPYVRLQTQQRTVPRKFNPITFINIFFHFSKPVSLSRFWLWPTNNKSTSILSSFFPWFSWYILIPLCCRPPLLSKNN